MKRYKLIQTSSGKTNNELDNIISKLKQLKLNREKAEEDEDEKMYDLSMQRTEDIRSILLKDESLLDDFLSEYEIKKIKFKRQDLLELV